MQAVLSHLWIVADLNADTAIRSSLLGFELAGAAADDGKVGA